MFKKKKKTHQNRAGEIKLEKGLPSKDGEPKLELQNTHLKKLVTVMKAETGRDLGVIDQ